MESLGSSTSELSFFLGGTPILGHTRDVRPEWVSSQGQNLRMGQFSNSVAAHLRTNEVEVTPRAFFAVYSKTITRNFTFTYRTMLGSGNFELSFFALY